MLDREPSQDGVLLASQLTQAQLTSALPQNYSTMDSVHKLPAKLVKEILSGELMELSKLLPKNFNTLNHSQDKPLTLAKENSVIKLNKAKVSSITDIEEWTMAITAYIGIVISKFPHSLSELFEYMSLKSYAARYHKGLAVCVYDIKFQQKATTNNSLSWSTTDSQLKLKTFTVAPLLLKKTGVFQSGPSLPSTSGGPKTVLVTTSTRVLPVPETLASTPINVLGLGVGKITSGSSTPVSLIKTKSLSQGWECSSPITTVPATNISSFGRVVTPVNVHVLYQALPKLNLAPN